MQLLMGMSMRRYLPPIGTAGLLRSIVRGYSRVPRPPPRIRLRTLSMGKWSVVARRRWSLDGFIILPHRRVAGERGFRCKIGEWGKGTYRPYESYQPLSPLATR